MLHSGNTLTLLDLNGDGKKDILFGHVSCQNTAALMNEGSLKRATFNNAEYDFPKKKPINFPIFQATYFEDIDFDGKKDLIAAPNNYDNASNTIDFQNSAWLYKNIGTSQKPDFQFQQTDFLQNTMLDVGENAAPILVDLDGDGDADLLIGTGGTRSDANGYRASIWYFENVGTPETANFILRTKDYLDLSKKYQLINIQPFISDMNGDGVADFGFSASSLKSNNLEIRYLPNKSARGLAFQIALEQIVEFPILDSFYRGDSPVFYDIDRDGKIDVLIASTSGNLAYFRNAGTNLAPQYHLETQNYGGVQADFLSMGVNANIADLNADGKPELLVATRTGFLKVYKNFLEQNVSKFVADSNLIFNELQSKNLALKIGGNPLLALADLNNDRLPDLILGSNTGGLRYLQNTSKLAVQTPTELEKISVFPNPSNGFVYVIVPYTADGELMNVLGQRISQKTFIANKELPIDLSGLPEGTYYLKITSLEKAPRTVKIFLKNGF